jgi:hypothetical protein
MTTARGTADDIRSALEECYATAKEQGFEGSYEDWMPTKADLEYVTDKLGRKPTEAQWKEAGLGWVGGAHVADK